MTENQPQAIRLADYRPPDYAVETVALDFTLGEEVTRVVATSRFMRAATAVPNAPLVLDGEDLRLIAIALDGCALGPADYKVDAQTLTIPAVPAEFSLEIVTEIAPRANTKLEGLYASGDVLCTQCEAEGFRRITYFPDRPDVMARYTVRLTADKTRFPVLLSNGNLVDCRDLGDGRHTAVWEDPFPKPSYLFAVVAADLGCLEDRFMTASGREVLLRIFTEHGDEPRCAYAMDALKRSMRWDEDRFGLEYDLDLFNIVAVSHFNMGAMENKSLNLFNAKYILADPATATDDDYASIEAVVAHEYFHNWTGNRVTCRDWFQLSLKEGLTVFRDQEFSADMRSRPVKRIQDVRALRAHQFQEDSGPLAHPVRPDSYIEINNFYTATVYEKGAEVIGMMHRLLGREGFRRGMDLYFRRHDGQAVTCDDFRQAMQDAGGVDLSQFALWYSQAGTPAVSAEGTYDADAGTFTLDLTQTLAPTPGQKQDQHGKAPMHVPLGLGLLGANGADLPLRMEGENEAGATGMRVIHLTERRQSFRFVDVPSRPVVSLNREFTAPIRLDGLGSDDDRAFLMTHDSDPFNRWEAGQQYATRLILDGIADFRSGTATAVDQAFVAAVRSTLQRAGEDRAFAALAVTLPSEEFVADQMEIVDVEATHAARRQLRRGLAQALRSDWLSAYRDHEGDGPFSPDAVSAGRRSLRNAALAYLSLLNDDDPDAAGLAAAQYRDAGNMTDRMAALGILAELDHPDRPAALDDFLDRYRGDAVVIDKWLAVQARSSLPDTLDRVRGLLDHPVFSMTNPNRVRALIGSFVMGNPVRFHAADGAGYAFLADQVLALDALNPQTAARLLTPLGRWARFDGGRQAKMKAELERILAKPDLSRDVYEIAVKTFGQSGAR